MFTPSSAKRRAMAFPIPREAPVIRATLPFIEFVIVPIPFNFNEVEIGAILAAIDDIKTNARLGDKIATFFYKINLF